MIMISLVIPVYNQASLLAKCLSSIERQSYDNYEIIVIDDGSTDDLKPVVQRYFDIFGHKLSFFDQENKGPNPARNRGARSAKGEYIIFCDADIELKPRLLELMVLALKNDPSASYCYSSFKWGWKTFKLWPFDPEKLKTMPYIHTCSLIRRQDFPGFDETIKKFQDWDLWLTMLERGKSGLWLDRILFKVNVTGKQTMSSWLPSLAYRFLPNLPQVKKYNQAMAIIKQKHHLL